MANIEEFNVIEPPTSGEVEELALRQISQSAVLMLGILGTSEVPRQEPGAISFRVAQTLHPEEGGMRIGGETEEGNFVIIATCKDPTQPATGSMARD